MFWHLLLAHFISDYPLQSDWMVKNRSRLRVRLLHGLIHFGLMVGLTFPASLRVWPFLLMLAGIHLAIDLMKGWSTGRLPEWNPAMYVVDQAIHYVTIGLFAFWSVSYATADPLISRPVVLVVMGFLLVTYIWLITERIIFAGHPGADELAASAWPRAWIRGGLLALILFSWYSLFPITIMLVIQLPYPATRSGARALLIDVLVTLAVAGLVITVNWV